jgi:inhibitor of KinA sporulation pathway (predicted exonuclease)
MLDMCIHEVRSIAVPSRLDYKSMIKKMHKLRQDTSLLCTVRCEGVYDRNHFHHNLLTNEFEKIDLDGDGQLSEAEVISYYRDIKNMKVPENFWEEDEDKDGVISFEEFRGPKGLTFDESDEHLSGDPENPSRLTRTIDHDLFKRARRIGHQAHGKHHRARGHATNKDEL